MARYQYSSDSGRTLRPGDPTILMDALLPDAASRADTAGLTVPGSPGLALAAITAASSIIVMSNN